jgi:hypothetical protein
MLSARRRWRRWMLLSAVLSAGLLAACSSPNQGRWRGTFDGTLSGTVEFQINSRGTALTGELEGATSDGQTFSAEMKGKLHDGYFYASFKGQGQTGLLPVPFEGLMKGELADGAASGDWDAELRTGWKLAGQWVAEQVR